MTEQTPAGWYPDTGGSGQLRYWDGNAWTDHFAAAQQPSQPPAAPRGQAAIACPHCGVAGGVKGRKVRQKQGVSGGKATGALLTGGVSLLATGLSRKTTVMKMRCSNCRMTWTVA